MAKLSKRAKAYRAQVEAGKVYSLMDALTLLKSIPAAKFVESVDVAINLGIDPRKSDQVVRGAAVLPNGTGKSVRVAVFAQGAAADAAKAAGADLVGMDELADEIKGGRSDFDVYARSSGWSAGFGFLNGRPGRSCTFVARLLQGKRQA